LTDVLTQLQAGLPSHYRVERELGRGGMATVWLAHDLKHDRRVAIKVIRPELAAALGADRFLREIRIAAHLQHPHILTLIDSGEKPGKSASEPGSLFYVMPYVEGESLRERLSRSGRLSADDAVRILLDVLDALVHAHSHGIVHRDIKPENIMLPGRHALVMDFGVAKALAAGQEAETGTLTALGLAIGTPAYMSPEQASGQASVDARADIYAVGVLAYEMLAGEPPFRGATPQAILAAHVTRTPQPLAELRSDVSPDLAAAVMRCLEKDPDRRWQSAEELLAHLERFTTPGSGTAATVAGRTAAGTRRWKTAHIVAAILLATVLGAALWFGVGRRLRDRRWAREQAIPQLLSLAEAGDWEPAYVLARRVAAILPGDSLFNAHRPKFSRAVSIRTDPPGAQVWRKSYEASDSTWILLGRTPLDTVLLALAGGGGGGGLFTNRLRIVAPGYRTLDLVGLPFRDSLIRLDRDDGIPPEMVRVAGGELNVRFPGFEHVQPIRLGDYLMDRYEVTNQEFKRFVDSGGYRRRELWEYSFIREGSEIPWKQAMTLMKDRTGRPGPSSWEAGEYPPGQEKHPVSGVSWYEALAFAKFAGKDIPTVAHWNHAASVTNSSVIVPLSNFAGQGARPVGTGRAISAYGTYDMGGNVREWCMNASGNARFILGGGWNDQPYQFNDAYTQLPFDRSMTNGIRLVKYLERDSNLVAAGRPLTRARRDFLKERPASDEVFSVYRRMYEYDREPFNAKVVETVDEGDWNRELVRMDAAYGNDSLLVYLYRPKSGLKPYPAVVYFPGSNAIRDRRLNLQLGNINFVIKSGRALLYPVYKGTYQRSDSLFTDVQNTSTFYRDHVIMWAKDLRRGIDYLETLPDIDTKRLAYYGVSWGGAMGGLMPAVEPRIKVNVLYVAGLDFERARPEVDPINFLPRVATPTLMLNGRYDFFFPIETSQVPMFRLLGTPADQKRHVVEEGSHFVPRTRLIQETLAWLDKYQPVPSGE
jgi:eukaryotic-like serine/threonine-protein kinase